jgi:metal-sulfur cluster biosynthetic enzyme
VDETKSIALDKEMERVREALKDVDDPELGISIVSMGMVRKVEAKDGGICITMILTTPTCPLADMIMEMVREAAQAATDQPVQVVLGTEQWDPSMMSSQVSSQMSS